MRMGEAPPQEGMPPLTDEDKNLVMHVGLPIIGGYLPMGTDTPKSMYFNVRMGSNSYICLSPDEL
jgi:PhnB protein